MMSEIHLNILHKKRIPYRKNFIISIFIFLVFVSIGCRNEDSFPSLGSDFIKSKYPVTLVDTFKTVFSTVLADSVATSGQGVALVGSYTDPYLGKIRSNSYFQIGYPYNYAVAEMQYFDSAVIILHFSNYSYGDLDKKFNINIHEVTENLTYKYNESGYLYNRTAPSINSTSIGRTEFFPKLLDYDSLTIRLNDDFGMYLFNILKVNTTNPYEILDFPSYHLYGLALMSDEDTDASILGFSADSTLLKLRIYSHFDAGTPEEYTDDFPLIHSSLQFNQITSDRSGTSISSLTDQKSPILSTYSDNLAFIEGGIGLLAKVQFPGLGELLLKKDKVVILKAELEISPVKNSYLKYQLPTSLIAYNTDLSNAAGTALTDYIGYSIYAALFRDELYNEDTRYTIDISNFINSEFSDNIFDYNHALLLALPLNNIFKTTDRLIIETNPEYRNRPKLKIYFLDI